MARSDFGRIPAHDLTQEDVDLIRDPQAFGLAPPLKRSERRVSIICAVLVALIAVVGAWACGNPIGYLMEIWR